jgi:alkylated DNA repair dioxygenase AlkB
MLEELKSEVKWNKEALLSDGTKTTLPRLMAYVSDKGEDYSYANLKIKGSSWNYTTYNIKEMVEKETGLSFNSCIINWYRDGKDKINWHSDKEKQLGENPVIVAFNLGEARTFHFRKRDNKSEKFSYLLESGDILIMDSDCQSLWDHAVLPEENKSERISLTFRNVSENLPL